MSNASRDPDADAAHRSTPQAVKRGFVGIDLGRELFEQVRVHLEKQGIKVSRGTIVDAAILPNLLHGDETRVWGPRLSGAEAGDARARA